MLSCPPGWIVDVAGVLGKEKPGKNETAQVRVVVSL
jgi:hypothetical protein